MKKLLLLIQIVGLSIFSHAQDWEGLMVPPSPGSGMVWELQENVSDDFNYDFAPTSSEAVIGGKWTNWFHNPWTGPDPGVWQRDHVFVADGKMKIKTSRVPGNAFFTYNGATHSLPVTYLGCATSTNRVIYPVYVETKVKIMNAVLASDVWLLSPDDTQEIDICEAYGSDRFTNSYFSPEKLHISHHVFIRNPFADWQPSDAGSFYDDGEGTIWRNDYHTIGVYWKDPWNLEYYVDGELVRTRSGKDEIDPLFHTNKFFLGDETKDTRTGLSKEMDIIINTEDQTWRAIAGLSPTDEELKDEEGHTFNVDWVRVYKPVAGEVGPVTGVVLDETEYTGYIEDKLSLRETVQPYNAMDMTVTWKSSDEDVATVTDEGLVELVGVGDAVITVTTNEAGKEATCAITVKGERIYSYFEVVDEDSYLSTTYDVGGEIVVNGTYSAGSDSEVISSGFGGGTYLLREMRSNGSAVKTVKTVIDNEMLGTASGESTITFSLDGVPGSAELSEGNYYAIEVSFGTSEPGVARATLGPIQIGPKAGIANNKYSKLKIYPNPANSTLYIKDIIKGDYELEVFNITGSKVDVEIENTSINISSLPKGSYVLRIISDKVYVTSFVKQ